MSAEDVIWEQLRGRRMAGCKFVRQHPIGPYFVDFLCREKKIAIEIDGWTHSTDEEIKSDLVKAQYLQKLGIRVLRAHNDEVYDNLDGVLDYIFQAMTEET